MYQQVKVILPLGLLVDDKFYCICNPRQQIRWGLPERSILEMRLIERKRKQPCFGSFFRFVFLLSFTDDVNIKDENVDGVYVAKKASEKGAFFSGLLFLT